MVLQSISVRGFRNLSDAKVDFSERFNVFSGDNGQGKTNLLEAIYVSCALRSFRTTSLKDLISIHSSQAKVSSWVERDGLERQYELTLSERSRVVRLDGKTVRPISKYFGSFQVILFAPEDLVIPKGSPSLRRRFLDRSVFNLKTGHLHSIQAYDKVLRSRNRVLKEPGYQKDRDRLLEVYDEQLADLGAVIAVDRLKYISEIRPIFKASFEAISQNDLHVDCSYQSKREAETPDYEVQKKSLLDAIQDSRAKDIARGQTNVGPHRDDLGFTLAGQGAQNFASQGQLRAIVLAWKSSEMKLVKSALGHAPILLLDDVSSELDPDRNAYFFSLLRSEDHQCFITTTHPDFVKLDGNRRDFSISNGSVEERS